MIGLDNKLSELKLSGDDHVVPFQVEGLDVRGRAVQLGPMLDQILSRHTYPKPVAQLLAEAITLTVLLGSSLKFEGRLILQTKGDGPVELLVADFQAPGAVRGYAQFDEAQVQQAMEYGQNEPHMLLGQGILAFTIDQGAHMQRYQGIVEMKGESLSEMAESYFRQSEQIPTNIKMAVAELLEKDDDGHPKHQWRAGGVLIQFLPQSAEKMRQGDLPGGDLPEGMDVAEMPVEESWLEAKVLVDTATSSELTDPQVGSERLLYRLFHERGVRIFDGGVVEDKCRCSRDSLFQVLSKMDSAELKENLVDGHIAVTCEFCSTDHIFNAQEFGL